jgi:heptosyltransferase-2
MNRLLVVLPNWYGETLFATPFLRALRHKYPKAFIATLGWPQCREVLLHNPRINEFIAYDEHGAHRSLLAKWRLVQRLGELCFDAAFILRRSLSRSLLLALAGIPMRIGARNAKSGWLLTHRVEPVRGVQHKAAAYFPLLEDMGSALAVGGCEYIVSDDERQAARELLNVRGLLMNGRALIVLHPAANWPHKRWPAGRFAALGDRLIESQHAQVVLTGGPDDVALAESVKHEMRNAPTILAGSTTLRGLGACLEYAHLIVSNDTGVLHIAAALRRPVVALYGPTSPMLTGPLGDSQRTVVVHHPDCCPQIPCYSPRQPQHPGMNAISVDEVYEAAVRLLNTHG